MLARRKVCFALLGSIGGMVIASGPATQAQQITGTPGSPGATMTIDGTQLPPPPQKFGGKIDREATQ